MSMLGSIKDVFVGQAMKLAGSPRVTKLMGDPRLMNAAMKAMSLGGAVKNNMDRAGKLAAGVFGLATQQEVATLRATIQGLEDTLASLEAKAKPSIRMEPSEGSKPPASEAGRQSPPASTRT